MSTPSEADRSNQNVQPPHSSLKDGDIPDSTHNSCSGVTCSVYDEYTTLLKKHLGVVESELNELKREKT